MSAVHPRSVDELLADLVRINSVNPEWGGPGEGALGQYVSDYFERLGLPVERREVLPGRFNVIATLPGRDRKRALLFEAHLDTVGVKEMTIDPFEPRIAEGRLRGRGACDVKGAMAALMQTIADLKRAGRAPGVDVILAAVVDEEHRFRGVNALIDGLKQRPEAAVVAEPTELKIARACKGVLRWRVVAHGRSAHSSRPELGADAILAMADVVRAIAADRPRLARRSHPLLGPPTCNVGLIEGGEQINFVAAHCAISLDRRLTPGEEISQVLREYDALLDPVRKEHRDVRIELEPALIEDAAMETPAEATIVRAASAAAARAGLDARPIGAPFGCDATKLSRAGIPSIICGPGSIAQAHTADEWVCLRELEIAMEFYRELILEYPDA